MILRNFIHSWHLLFTWKTRCSLKFHFAQFDRSEICTEVSFFHYTRSHVNADNEVTSHRSEILPRSQLPRYFLEKPFQAPKIIFKSPKLIGQEPLSYRHLLKDKRLKFTFLRESQPFRFCYVEVHCQRRLKSKKGGISS